MPQDGGHEPDSFKGKSSKLTAFDDVSVHRFRWIFLLNVVRHTEKRLLMQTMKKKRKIDEMKIQTEVDLEPK